MFINRLIALSILFIFFTIVSIFFVAFRIYFGKPIRDSLVFCLLEIAYLFIFISLWQLMASYLTDYMFGDNGFFRQVMDLYEMNGKP